MAQKLRMFLTFLLSLALVFTLISCEDSSSDDGSSTTPTEENTSDDNSDEDSNSDSDNSIVGYWKFDKTYDEDGTELEWEKGAVQLKSDNTSIFYSWEDDNYIYDDDSRNYTFSNNVFTFVSEDEDEDDVYDVTLTSTSMTWTKQGEVEEGDGMKYTFIKAAESEFADAVKYEPIMVDVTVNGEVLEFEVEDNILLLSDYFSDEEYDHSYRLHLLREDQGIRIPIGIPLSTNEPTTYDENTIKEKNVPTIFYKVHENNNFDDDSTSWVPGTFTINITKWENNKVNLNFNATLHSEGQEDIVLSGSVVDVDIDEFDEK